MRRRTPWIVAICLLAALPVSCDGESIDAALPGRAGLIAPVGPVARGCAGVSVHPSEDVQSVIDAHAAGTTYCLSPGVYRLEQPLEPKRGDALIGRQGAVVSGSKVLTGWRRNGGVWSTTGFLPAKPGNHGECLDSVPTCAYTEDVFVDKRRLRRVGSKSAVTVGTVHADYGTNTITIGDDPRLHLVEQAVAPSLIRATVDKVVVANLVLEQAANEAQVAAVEARRTTPYGMGSDWRISHNEVRLNHGVGLGLADGAVVTANLVHHQGQLGFGAWGNGSVVSGNEISFNGMAGYSPDWEAGGSKSWHTDRHTVRHNYVHDNHGPGLWTDGGNMRTDYSFNKITGNWGAGIQHEMSYDATIKENEITGNGRRHKGWAWEAGIQIQSSGGTGLIEVAGNTLGDNANGIALIESGGRLDEQPAPYGPHVVRNVWVHDNRVRLSAGQTTGAVQDIGDTTVYTGAGNRFENNTYVVSSLNGRYFSWNDTDLTWTEWLVAGNDNGGRAERTGR
ncbi:right-handed parallel beta-helix repeat-containing protein [Kribbella capetownensis]|uniref:right-handed parallel beta-helix repeat-containing protein n=1 Tax=Kribbella capetownensis TaxID=1572659 RepID=UPI0013F3A9AC|nr:right-handed parallel beta-helix repeat-containing protein [Kribbella capetownensis]